MIAGDLALVNQTERREIFIPELSAEVTLLSKGSLAGITHQAQIEPRHYDAPARPDGYWFAYIVKQKPTHAGFRLDISGADLSDLQSAWIRLHYVTYGPQGRIPRVQHVVLPLRVPNPTDSQQWRSTDQSSILPIRTHLLSQIDQPGRAACNPHAGPHLIAYVIVHRSFVAGQARSQ